MSTADEIGESARISPKYVISFQIKWIECWSYADFKRNLDKVLRIEEKVKTVGKNLQDTNVSHEFKSLKAHAHARNSTCTMIKTVKSDHADKMIKLSHYLK